MKNQKKKNQQEKVNKKNLYHIVCYLTFYEQKKVKDKKMNEGK